MGPMVEINDTLQLTAEQGFPADLLDRAAHCRKPITLQDVCKRVFAFQHKPRARIFQLDPVRVYYAHNIEGKWLFWGRVLIQSLSIEKNRRADGSLIVKPRRGEPDADWITSGTYTVLDLYDPEYQEAFTRREAPADRNFFLA